MLSLDHDFELMNQLLIDWQLELRTAHNLWWPLRTHQSERKAEQRPLVIQLMRFTLSRELNLYKLLLVNKQHMKESVWFT